jgi:hypothetical protein
MEESGSPQNRLRHATGQARGRVNQAERQIRQTIETTLEHLTGVVNRLEPRVRRAWHQTRAIQAALLAGLKAGAARYRAERRK